MIINRGSINPVKTTLGYLVHLKDVIDLKIGSKTSSLGSKAPHVRGAFFLKKNILMQLYGVFVALTKNFVLSLHSAISINFSVSQFFVKLHEGVNHFYPVGVYILQYQSSTSPRSMPSSSLRSSVGVSSTLNIVLPQDIYKLELNKILH